MTSLCWLDHFIQQMRCSSFADSHTGGASAFLALLPVTSQPNLSHFHHSVTSPPVTVPKESRRHGASLGACTDTHCPLPAAAVLRRALTLCHSLPAAAKLLSCLFPGSDKLNPASLVVLAGNECHSPAWEGRLVGGQTHAVHTLPCMIQCVC